MKKQIQSVCEALPKSSWTLIGWTMNPNTIRIIGFCSVWVHLSLNKQQVNKNNQTDTNSWNLHVNCFYKYEPRLHLQVSVYHHHLSWGSRMVQRSGFCLYILYIFTCLYFPISPGVWASYATPPPAPPAAPPPPRPGPPVLRLCHSLTNGSRFFQMSSWPNRMYQLEERGQRAWWETEFCCHTQHHTVSVLLHSEHPRVQFKSEVLLLFMTLSSYKSYKIWCFITNKTPWQFIRVHLKQSDN